MSAFRVSGEWRKGVVAACQRLSFSLPLQKDDASEQVRLVGLLLIAPLFLSAFAAPILSGNLELPVLIALICAITASAWGVVAILAAGGSLSTVRMLALLTGAVVLAGVIRSAGFLSPAGLILVALPIEGWWVTRRRAGFDLGLMAALAALVTATSIQHLAPVQVAPVEIWHWILPLVYLSAVLTRIADFRGDASVDVEPISDLEMLADCGVLRFDRSGDLVGANEQAEELLRLPLIHLRGGSLFERIHIQDRVAYLAAVDGARHDGETRDVEIRIAVPEGEVSTVTRRFSLRMVRRGDGQLFGLLRDRQEAYDLAQVAERATQNADSFDIAKGRFLAAVSHELRTPLNAIIGFSDMMLQGMAGPFADPRQSEYVGIVRESGQHLLSVVNAILDVSKIESGTYAISPEPFRFAEAVELCRSMMVVQAEAKQIGLRVQIERGVGELCGDRRAIQQTLINLVANAIKFTPDGGSVTIGAHRQGRKLQFWVADTGIGIAECDLERLGRPFMQLNNDYTRHFEGAGLGLSIVKGLVALHGGSVAVSSRQGHGTTVTVTLPIDGVKTHDDEASDNAVKHATQDDHEALRKIA